MTCMESIFSSGLVVITNELSEIGCEITDGNVKVPTISVWNIFIRKIKNTAAT